jgi:hypothetical protein
MPRIISPGGGAAGTFAPQLPNLVAPFDPRLANTVAAPGANIAWGCRVTIPKAGTLTDLAIYIGTSSGNADVGVYDATAATRNRLFSTGSIACPAGVQWTIVGNPNLAVAQGDQLDFAVVFDNATATVLRFQGAQSAQTQLPTGFWPAALGGTPRLSWSKTTAFPLPATTTEATIAANLAVAVIIARVA